jgi:hypothetical protein
MATSQNPEFRIKTIKFELPHCSIAPGKGYPNKTENPIADPVRETDRIR